MSDSFLHSILHFELPGFQLATKVCLQGTGKREFYFTRQLTAVPNMAVFVAYIAYRDNNQVVE